MTARNAITPARVAPRVIRNHTGDGQAACVMAFIEAGSWFDPLGKSGLAHFYEHGFFAGTAAHPTAADLAGAISDLGCTFNAHTLAEYSYYYLSGPCTTAAPALDLLLTSYCSPLWDSAELRKQRIAMDNELRLFGDSHQRRLRQVASMTLHGPGPFGLSPLGEPAEVARLDRADIAWFAGRVATPDRLTIVIDSPDIGHDFDATLRVHMDNLPVSDPASPRVAGYGEPFNVHLEVPAKVALVAVVIPGVSYQLSRREMYAMRLFHTVLGGGSSSRLTTMLRDQLGLSYQARTVLEPHANTGGLFVIFACAPEAVTNAVTSVHALVERTLLEPPAARELTRAIEISRGTHVRERESAADRCAVAAHELFRRGEMASDQELFDTWGLLDAQEVLDVARRVLRVSESRCVVAGPPGDGHLPVDVPMLQGPWQSIGS